MHAGHLGDSRPRVHFRVGDAAEFGEQRVDDPGVVVVDCFGGEEVEGEGGEEVEGGLDVGLECEGEGAGDGFGSRGEIAPEVFGLGEGEGVEGLGLGHGDCAGEEEGVEGVCGGKGVRVVGGDGVVLDATDCGMVE